MIFALVCTSGKRTCIFLCGVIDITVSPMRADISGQWPSEFSTITYNLLIHFPVKII